MTDAAALFEAGQFQAVVTHLEGQASSVREHTLLGIALIRVRRLADAEVTLTRAAMQGDPEAQVELGNVLRLLGRFDEAVTHLETIAPGLTGELQLRALRWWGVADFQAGRTETGLRRVERAWHGYLALGDDDFSARVTTSLAQMYHTLGDDKRAGALLTEALRVLPDAPDPGPRVGTLKLLLDLHLAQGELTQAHEVLAEAQRCLQGTEAPLLSAVLLTSEAELCRLTGAAEAYAAVLNRLEAVAEQLDDRELRLWTVSRLAEHHSLYGRHAEAVDALLGYGLMPQDWPAELWATNGIVERRRGDLAAAEASLSRAAGMLRASGQTPELCRVLLHLAATSLRLGGEAVQGQVIPALTEAVTQLLRLRQLTEFRPDFEELSELLHYALLEPDTASLMEPLLQRLAHLAATVSLPRHLAVQSTTTSRIHVTVKTLGQMVVLRDGVTVPFTRKGCVPLLAYLALKPGRTRVQIQLDLWPDKEPVTAGAYVRQCLKELRDRLGEPLISSEGPHHGPQYRLSHLAEVEFDFAHLLDAVDRKELAQALALYRGEFLPDADPCEWIDTQRETLLLALTLELRTQMRAAQRAGDHRRVVLLANQALRVDPHDRDVLEERVASARLVASSYEVARYIAELHRAQYN